jgi:hypothetical protein
MAAQPYGLVAVFDTAPAVYHAAETVRDAGYKCWEGLMSTSRLDSLEAQRNFLHTLNARCPYAVSSFCTQFLRDRNQKVVPNPDGCLPHLPSAHKICIAHTCLQKLRDGLCVGLLCCPGFHG